MKRPRVKLISRSLMVPEVFHYQWLDIHTGETGTEIFVVTRIEFLEWINRWNLMNPDFKYWEVTK